MMHGQKNIKLLLNALHVLTLLNSSLNLFMCFVLCMILRANI